MVNHYYKHIEEVQIVKKAWLAIIAIILLLSLCACAEDENQYISNADIPPQQSSENDSSDEDVYVPWGTQYYVDEFKQPTDYGYIVTATIGSFCNSATTDSDLFVGVVVDKENISIHMLEYGSYPVKNNSNSYNDIYNIKMRTSDGTDYNFTGTMYCGSDRIFIDPNYISNVINAFSQSEDSITLFYIESSDNPTTNYLFSIKSDGFAEQYNALKK